MDTFVRRFDGKHGSEEKLTAELAGFPGTFRIYGVDRWATGQRLHVEFKTDDHDAAMEFLKNDLTLG
jgi:hypothetical protein